MAFTIIAERSDVTIYNRVANAWEANAIAKERRETGATKVEVFGVDNGPVSALELAAASRPATPSKHRSMFLNLRSGPAIPPAASETPAETSSTSVPGRVRIFKAKSTGG